MTTKYDATVDRKNMELILDYEIQSSPLYPLFDVLDTCGFTSLLGWYYGRKVTRKYALYLQRGSVMDAIVAERGPYGGFSKP
ncbi:MAG TPA: hypothetical protein VHO25_23040 [Polyangiaceae bacterium]|nr:hypothetical protein [Polyangiaceae bacterium]